MKFLFVLLFVSTASYAETTIFRDQVRSYKESRRETEITLWGRNSVYRMNKEHGLNPCFKNAKMSDMLVDVGVDERGRLVSCRLASKPHPGQTSSAR